MDIYEHVKDHGPGPHMLTGADLHRGVRSQETSLEVRIQKIRLAIPYALNAFSPGRGFLPEDFPYERVKVIPLDEKRMVAQFADGIEIPLHPFFGSMGVAPPASAGRISSAPPVGERGESGQQRVGCGLDAVYPDSRVRRTLRDRPTATRGQGDGEVDITAMETSLVGTFQFIVQQGHAPPLAARAETPTAFITMGLHEDLNESNQDVSPRNDRIPDAGETHAARRRLHAGQRRGGPPHYATRRW